MKLPPIWIMLAIQYTAWNLSQYLSKSIHGDNQRAIDITYWLNERIFVVGVWVYVYYKESNPNSRFHKYAWIAKTFIWIAVLKSAYLLAILLTWIKPNDLAALMGFIFIIVIGYITVRWEKLQ